MAIIGQICLSLFKPFYRIKITVTKLLRNALSALLECPHLGPPTKKWQRTFNELLDNASVKVKQDDSSVLSELHMGLSVTR